MAVAVGDVVAQGSPPAEAARALVPVDPETAPRPTLRATRVAVPMVIDGRLDEAAWNEAEPIDEFVQAQPRPGYPATERTIVRVLYDAERLYIGAECLDSEVGRITVPALEQDFESQDSDIFGVTLDTFFDRRNAFMFLINPRGAVKDTQNADDSRSENGAWEGVILLETRVHERGWTVELAIPFTTVRFDPGRDPQDWGINFLRRIRRKNEDALWAPLDRRDRVHRMSKAGTLVGLQGLRAGRNLTVKPFGLASAAGGTQRPASADRYDVDGGVDVKYGLTPRMALDLTWRTDFSQVEVDQEQVNLTRFSLFFPEKRDFFMENAGIFQVGDVSDRNYRTSSSLSDFTLFHSRRIGLSDGGRVIPIVGGGRLTGRAAGFEVGALNMQTQAVDGNPSENFTVLRVRRSVQGRADVGTLFVNRQVTGDERLARDRYNRTVAVDANLRPFGALAVNSYLAATDAPSQTGDGRAARLSVGWRDRFWDTSAFIKHVGEAFDPGVGFVRRTGVRHAYATFGVHQRPRMPLFQELNPYAEIDYITTVASVLDTRTATVGFDAQLRDGGRFTIETRDTFERVTEAFNAGGAQVVPGEYDFTDTTVSYNSSAGRHLSGKVSVASGGFYGGDKRTMGGSVLWRPTYHLSLDGSVTRNDITLGGRSFAADVYGARIKVGFSTKLFASAFVQLNTATDQRVVNVRLNYLHAPLSHLYVTYTERDATTSASGVLERALTVKVTRLFAF